MKGSQTAATRILERQRQWAAWAGLNDRYFGRWAA
jgi:hypothetical protein